MYLYSAVIFPSVYANGLESLGGREREGGKQGTGHDSEALSVSLCKPGLVALQKWIEFKILGLGKWLQWADQGHSWGGPDEEQSGGSVTEAKIWIISQWTVLSADYATEEDSKQLTD